MEANAERITALMRHLAPVLKKPHKGRRAGALRDSIGWRYKETQGEKGGGSNVMGASIGSAKDMEILIYAGGNNPDDPYYARIVEFGVHEQTKGQILFQIRKKGRIRRRKSRRTVSFIPPQPFFFPAFRALKRSAGSLITRAAKDALKKTAQRS